MPLVSVVIPTYNCSGLLGYAIDSVANQTFKDVEVIVVDDGSTDDTPAIAERYKGLVSYYKQANSGSSVARTVGVSLSSGKYVAALDADDMWLPHKLEYQVELMEADSAAGLCYTDGFRFTADNTAKGTRLSSIYPCGRSGWQFDFMFKTVAAATSSMLFRRDAYESIGGYDRCIPYCDAEFLIRMAAHFPLVYVPVPLMMYRVHSANTSNHITKHNAAKTLQFIRQIRLTATACLDPKVGDPSVQLFRRGPTAIQWALLLYWQFRYVSPLHVFQRLLLYGSRLVQRELGAGYSSALPRE